MDIYLFENSGNNCYFIVAIHAIIDMLQVKKILDTSSVITNTFTNIINSPIVKVSEGYNIHQLANIEEFKKGLAMSNKFFVSHEQQDSSECFLQILDQFTKENTIKSYRGIYDTPKRYKDLPENIFNKSLIHLKDYDKKHGYSPVSELYLGQYIFKKTCLNCNDITYSFEEFVNIDLVPNNTSLTACISEYFKIERVELECDKCHYAYVDRKINIFKYPNILVICIKRFDDNTYNSSVDITNKLAIKNNDQIIKYSLRLIIHHIGNSNSGHYYVTLHHGDDYVIINDGHVSKSKNTDFTKSAYMIFYEIA